MRQAALLISHPGCLLASVLKIQLVLDPAQGALMSPQAEPPRKLRQQRGVTTALDPTRGHELFSVARVPTQCIGGQGQWPRGATCLAMERHSPDFQLLLLAQVHQDKPIASKPHVRTWEGGYSIRAAVIKKSSSCFLESKSIWQDRKSTRLNSSHTLASRMPSSA